VASSGGVSRLRIGMGTMIAIEADAGTPQGSLAALEAGFAAILQVETLMHPSRAGSDLPAIRQADPGVPIAVHAWTWEVLTLSRRLNLMSGGAFDPCLPDSAGRLSDLEFVAPQSVIAHRPLHLDLGGIAKGYAVDRALLAMRGAGCDDGLVNAGGDLAVFGAHSRCIVIKQPGNDDLVVELENSALATSEVGGAIRPAEHRGYYHGLNLREIRSGGVTVAAPLAAVADALTKCLLAGAIDTHASLLAAFGARLVSRNPRHPRELVS